MTQGNFFDLPSRHPTGVCIMGAMRVACLITVFLLMGGCLAMAALPGCEEVLEACQPCGVLLEGNRTISGDPRIDGTFDALQEIRLTVERMERDYERRVAELMTTFSLPEGADFTALKAEVVRLFGPSSASPMAAAVFPGRCFVDWESATDAERRCEQRLCNTQVSSTAGLCRGHFIGGCPVSAGGPCYQEAGGACDGLCIGVCNGMTEGDCPGICRGVCDAGTCFGFDERGDCSGHCSGACSGICEEDAPFDCNGVCTGDCSREVDAGCDGTGELRGECPEPVEPGACRGHLFAAGCDDQCRDCLEEAMDCREMAKFVAWSRMRCDGASVILSLDMGGEPPDPDLRRLMARTLERILSAVAADHGWLLLLVDGVDAADELAPADLMRENEESRLDNGASQYFEIDDLPVDLSRAQLPLENLKARVAWLGEKVLSSEAGYQVAAGAYPCAVQALQDAEGWAQGWVPVIANPAGADGDRPYVADRQCETVAPDGAVPCLYDLLERQAELLELMEF